MFEHVRMLTVAKRFLDAANSLSKQGGQLWGFPVPHYLAGHAIELALKAHLAHRGSDEASLKKLGHSLVKSLGKADTRIRATLTPEHIAAINGLDSYYAGKRLEYSAWGASGGLISIPDIAYLLQAGERLVEHLDGIFRAEARASRIQRAAPGTPSP